MKVTFAPSFKRAFKKRIRATALEVRFWKKLDLFINDPFSPELKTHKLSGRLAAYWSFTVEYDCRVVFYFADEAAVLIDIGSHEQVY
jgi:addiction module RelE/StbE family toxin